MLLGGDRRRRRPAGRGQHRPQGRVPDAVQRGMHHRESRPGAGTSATGRHGRDVSAYRLIGRRERERPLGPARGQPQGVDLVDEGGDVGVGRRQQLPAVAHVDLDPVVLARVVAGGHHHPVGGVQMPHREGEHRGRQRPGQHRHADARPGQDPGDVGGEQVGLGAAVVADHDAVRRRGRVPGRDIAGQASRHAAGHQPVHAHRAGAHRGPDAGRAEGQRALESHRQLGGRVHSVPCA